MSSIEIDLISKILEDRDLASVTDAGVTPNYFQNYDNRLAFEFIVEHQHQYSKVPSLDALVSGHDPTFKMSEPQDPLKYYTDKVTEAYTLFLLEQGLSEMVDLFERGDYETTKKRLAETLNLLNKEVSATRVTDLTQTGEARLERYRSYIKTGEALRGISSGFDAIDAATGGFQAKQLITIAGPPKAGKSTILLLADMAAHKAFYTPLFIGFEMSNEEQEERHDAIRAKVSNKKLRDGALEFEELAAIKKMMKRMENHPEMYFSEDANSTLTISGVAAQVDRYKPDIVFIDGVYMMEDDNGERKGSPQALTNITRGLKQMAKNLDICIVITTQVLEWKMDRKKGVTSNSIGYTSSFAQDSDCLIAVERTDDPDTQKLKVVIARNNPGMEVFIRWDWSTGDFEEVDEYVAPEDEPATKF